MIYFVRAKSGTRIKIGTTVRLTQRLAQFRSDVGDDIDILGVLEGSHKEESALHQRFAHLRRYGEWFDPGNDLLEFIKHECLPWDGSDEAPSLRTLKVDREVVFLIRQASAKLGMSSQEYISDALNLACAKELGIGPVKRKPPKPRGK